MGNQNWKLKFKIEMGNQNWKLNLKIENKIEIGN